MVLSAKPPREREAAADHQREAATQLWPQHPRWLRGTEGLAQPNRSPQAQQRLLCPPARAPSLHLQRTVQNPRDVYTWRSKADPSSNTCSGPLQP